ncbi:protein IRX15-LIKE-like [Chenopodium quinoa]|nr:protein IRX15-LIKE-like [Chenopodium quinoa]
MKNNNNTNNTKLILLHPYILKQGSSNRLWFLAVISIFTLIFLLTLIYTRDSFSAYSSSTPSTTAATSGVAASNDVGHTTSRYPLPKNVVSTLLHYSSRANTTEKMDIADTKSISDVLRRCPSPCNFLVFGLTHETLLWRSLNNHGRTVFIDENRYYAAYMEEKHPEIEAYDAQYTTKLSEYKELISSVKEQAHNECKPVQNLLFSECKLGINDLPNQIYDIDWDVILIDGPRGHWHSAPGRMSTIYTSSVLARNKKASAKSGKTHVFVHDYNLDPQRVSSEEFLCKENLVENNGMLAHFVLERMDENCFEFCHYKKKSS